MISMISDKNILISAHAVEKFLERVYSRDNTEEAAIRRMRAIVKHGKITGFRPGKAYNIEFEGISLVCIKIGNKIKVITCLGDRRYRGWARKKEIWPRYKRRVAC